MILMAMARTEAEKFRIIKRCQEIEREGGDVLEYLKSENYISPRATWINFQKYELGREGRFITDGKPKKPKGRITTVNQQKKDWVAFANEVISKDEDPIKVLAELGYKNTYATMSHAIDVIEKTDPDLAVAVEEHFKKFRKTGKGKETVKAEEVVEAVNKEAPAVAEAPVITKPLNYMGYTVRAIEGKLGRFSYNEKYDVFEWETPDGTEVNLDTLEWRQLLKELPTIMAILGVKE